jgi:hypothetical protein
LRDITAPGRGAAWSAQPFADTEALDRAFGAHRDALTGVEPEARYAELFRAIVRVRPAPYGVGAPIAG